MAKKRKRKNGRIVAAGGVIGAILFFILNGNFSADFFGDGNQLDLSPAQVEENQTDGEITKKEDLIIEITGNAIFVNDQEVTLETLMDALDSQKQIVLRASNAKQVIYDDVKKLLQSNEIVIVEE